ncbi:DUF4395 domain-containing protein (plasmid) [Rhodococcus antarcticus]|uniref:DUF4395 domain-containing protein n=1 Tax=Rhodococcus antarcticus TaxID=2987751 RepID=A0ABY6P5J9_9NOCA|nr:DUF4395 family protein [Rhodococcus antarcticus]UZJ26932.1 DUF4395 domain-containing protein [Rhodococcus antarcticus]
MLGAGRTAATNMDKQGFGDLDAAAKSRYAVPLRFTPALGTALIVVGLVLQSPLWLAAVAVIALSGVLLPEAMVLDLVYNHGVRHLFGGPALPPTPPPRRFSYALSATLLAGSALAFTLGLPAWGYLLGGAVAVGGTILTLTLWCLGSWIYRLIPGRTPATTTNPR